MQLKVLRNDLEARLANRRLYLVLDCCFAGAAVKEFMGAGVNTVVATAVQEALPPRGWVVLAASSSSLPAMAPSGQDLTMFTGALVHVLRGAAQPLSFDDIAVETGRVIRIAHGARGVAPECHAPMQHGGNLRRAGLFGGRGLKPAGDFGAFGPPAAAAAPARGSGPAVSPEPVVEAVPLPAPSVPGWAARLNSFFSVSSVSPPAPRRDPDWAVARGEDACGRWARFSVPGANGSRVAQRLRWIPPGRFLMGSPDDEDGRYGNEGPLHEVVFARGFWLLDTACRQELWQAVMGDNPSHFKGPARPVENVSFEDMQKFLARVNARVPGLDLMLPSEAQWEYACRAGTATAYSFGPEISRQQVNYHSSEGTVPVGSLPANRWGLHEMHGNVWEWCADTWHGSYVGAPADGSAWIDGGTAYRVVRGGSWNCPARSVRAAYRLAPGPARRFVHLGFRCSRVQ